MQSGSETPARVLVIDDETAICRIMTRTLERQGFKAASVFYAHEVAATLTSGEFDVILLDRSMTLADGESLVPLVNQHKKSAKVLFFTGEYVDSEELKQVDGVVQKPIHGHELADTLRKLLA